MRVRSGYLVALLVAGALVAGIVRFGPALALVIALGLPSATPRAADARRENITVPAAGRSLPADLYRPAKPQGALLLVHGLSRAGRRHPELARLAHLLARQGQLVLVPEFEELTAFRLSGGEVEEIRSALRHLGSLNAHVGIAGFSFGAGPALIAAASIPGLRVAGSFGGYADLRHVVTYITTGAHTFGAQRYVERQEEYNRWKLLALLLGFVEDPRDRGGLEIIAARRLANPSGDTGAAEAALGREGQAVLALVRNRQEERVAPLLAGLPAGAQQAIDRLSPLPAISRLSGRLLIAHGAGDDSIPFTESLRLAEAAGGRARVAILRTFQHTGPRPLWESLSQRAQDGWSLFRLVDDLLAGD